MEKKVYGIEVHECFSKVVYVKADSKEQAYDWVKKAYFDTGEVAMNNDDYYETQFDHYDDGVVDDCFDFDISSGDGLENVVVA